MIPEPTHVGSFQLKGTALIVADPCNTQMSIEQEKTLPPGIIEHVNGCKAGVWEVFLSIKEVVFERDGKPVPRKYCWALSVFHQEVTDQIKWALETEIMADSGQIGIFEADFFGDDSAVRDCPKALQDSFYGACVYLTFDESNKEQRFGGCLDFGAVALSGFGDGVYPVNVGREGDLVVGLHIPFILPDNDGSEG